MKAKNSKFLFLINIHLCSYFNTIQQNNNNYFFLGTGAFVGGLAGVPGLPTGAFALGV